MTTNVFRLLIQFLSQRPSSSILETCPTTRNTNFFHCLVEGYFLNVNVLTNSFCIKEDGNPDDYVLYEIS